MADSVVFDSLGFEAHLRGETVDEIIGFPAFVAALDRQPHAVLLDQNLDLFETGEHVTGCTLIPQVRAAGFTGKVIIRSANTTSSDRVSYAASGADGTLDKALIGKEFCNELAKILAGAPQSDAAS